MAAKAKQKKATEAITFEWTSRRWSKEVLSAIPWNDYQVAVFEELQNSEDNLVVSATAGSGKCLHGDSLVAINGCLTPAKAIWEDYHTEESFDGEGYTSLPSQPLYVDSFDEVKLEFVRKPILGIYRQQVKEPLRRIELSDGSQITITKAHKLYDGFNWTNQFSVGDTVAVPNRLSTEMYAANPDKASRRTAEKGHKGLNKIQLGQRIQGNQWRPDVTVDLEVKRSINSATTKLRNLIDQPLEYPTITRIEEFMYEGEVYDFQVADTQNFVAENILCHNSTLLKGIIGLLPTSSKINVMMFNISVKDAFEKDPRIPKRVTVSTAHGCGYGLLIGYFRGDAPKVDANKARNLAEWGLKRLRDLMSDKSRYHPVPLPKLPEDRELGEIYLEKWCEALRQLIDMARLNLANNDVESLEWVASYFAIRFPFGKRGTAWGIRMAIDLLEDCFRMGAYDREIDYADMVWLPHKLKLYPRKPKATKAYLLVDECVSGSTLVTLADGSTTRIDEIVRNKLSLDILSFNTNTKQVEVKKISGWHEVPRRNRAIIDVNGLKATEDHPVYTKEQGYIYAGQLNSQHSLLKIDGQKLQSFRQTNDDRTFNYNRIASWRCFTGEQSVERQNGQCQDSFQTWSSTARLPSVETRQPDPVGWKQRAVTPNADRVWWGSSEFCDDISPAFYGNIPPVQANWSEKTNHRSSFKSTKPSCFGGLVHGRRQLQQYLPDIDICIPNGRNRSSSSSFNRNGVQLQISANKQRWSAGLFGCWSRSIFSNYQTTYSPISFLQTRSGENTGNQESKAVCDSDNKTLQPLWTSTRDISLHKYSSVLPLLLQQQLSERCEKSFSDKPNENVFMSSLQQRVPESPKSDNRGNPIQDMQRSLWSNFENSTETRASTKTPMSYLRYSLPISQQLQERSWSLSANLQQQMWRDIDSAKNQNEEDWVYCIDVEDNHNFFGNGILSHNCQDANRAFISLYKKYEIVGYRCIFVGDPFQSISGYMGALPTATDTIIKLFNAKVLPLSESQRCPQSQVALASLISPQMKARADAIDGTCKLMYPDNVKSSVQPGNLVLCRFVSPLIKIFLEAKFFHGQQGIVRSRDIAKEMGGFAKQIGKNCKWSNFHTKLVSQKEDLVERYKTAGQLTQADATDDRYQCLEYCYEFLGKSAGSLKEFVACLDEAFPVEEEDRSRHVIYSSIHSAKGDESSAIYIVGINLLPYYRLGMLNWQFQQEIYATFVALTRSKATMYFVPLERDPVQLELLMQLPCAGLKMEYFEGYQGDLTANS